MPSQLRYRLQFSWIHKTKGPQIQTGTAEATSIRQAISAGLLAFFSNSTLRKTNADAHASLEVKCWRTKKPAAR